MSSIQLLRVLVNERLSAAAEEIFEAVKKTIAGYEEEIQISRREIRRQRKILQTVSKDQINSSEPPQLTLSVWDEEWSPSLDHSNVSQQPPQTEKIQEDPPSTQEVEPLQELQEDTTIRFIFTSPYVKSELDELQTDFQNIKTEGDPLPSTSAEQNQTKVEDEDGASDVSSVTDHSDEEWRGAAISHDDDSESESSPNRMAPVQPVAPKPQTTKKLKNRISCKICGRAFHATVSLVNHMEVHPKDVCGVCGERLETEEAFQVHLKTHVKAEICKVCGKCFGASSSLQTHMRIHTGEKPFRCNECGKSFNCRHNMMRHSRIHTGERPYCCTVCGKCFNDYTTLKRHRMTHEQKKNMILTYTANENEHGGETEAKTPSPKKPLSRTVCEVCGKTFHSMVSLVNHAKSHSTDLCGVCGMHFDSEETLKLHLKTHKNGKVCEVCGKCFDSQGNLEMHMRVHTGEKPFLCSECGKSFNCRHNMMRHIRTHTGEKPYLCNFCGRSFSDHSTMKQHTSTHTGEKPHRCEICGKGFHRKTYVRLHMKSHSME
ncbi:gastrula zinc finger protein XlCGF57.1-like [Cheilinus undulatus]|uniref:gastrula zinc finger protein XlCGF57.1-like n=1 Tax=Cheilinus undulatus TaxID=241271 RepID=UPI001BD58918|nr:gastrula zinc finger protein XlCGF57.1-like [Cheilinus undulatus]